MAVSIISGAITSRNVEQTTIKPQVSTAIDLYDANIAPFTHLMRMIKVRPVNGPYYYWYDDEYVPEWTTASAEAGIGDTTIDVETGTGAYFTGGDIILHPASGCIHRVVSVTGDVLTVVRAVGTTSDAKISNGDNLFKIGESFAENTLAPAAVVTKVVKRDNYTQIFKKTVEESRTSMMTEKWTGPERARQRVKKLKLMKIDMEKSALWSEPYEDTSGSTPIRTTGGIFNVIPASNVYDANAHSGGALSEAGWRSMTRDMWRYVSSGVLYCFTSSLVCSRLDTWAAGGLQLLPEEKTYGVRINRYVTNLGELRIIYHHLFINNYASQALFVDLDNCYYRPMLDITLTIDVQTPGQDGVKDEWKAEAGFQFAMAKSHSRAHTIS